MTPDQTTVFLILFTSLVLFAWGKIRYDLVALIAMMALLLFNLVTPQEAFSGFGHTAVITVAAVLVISQALKNAGVVDLVASYLLPYSSNAIVHIALLTCVVTFFSAFMNNVGALALLLPVAITTCKANNRSPAMVLMPVAFGSILGGMSTMIGTPPNIIIANYRHDVTGTAFSMFDFSPIGAIIAVIGVAFISLIGWRLIPKKRLQENSPEQLFEVSAYLTEAKVLATSPLIGLAVKEIEALQNENIGIAGVANGKRLTLNTNPQHALKEGDILIFRGDPSSLQSTFAESQLEVQTASGKTLDGLTAEELSLSECVITATSPLVGRDVAYLRRHTANSVALIGLAHQGKVVRKRLRHHIFNTGDILLLQSETAFVNDMLGELNLLPLAQRDIQLGQSRRVVIAISIFMVAIALGSLNVLPMAGAFIAAALAYALMGLLPGKDVYRNIDWPIIILLGAMIPVGSALESTGATQLVASSIVYLTSGLPLYVIIGLILVTTMFLSDIINNAATALVMAPISVGIANQLGVNIDPFLMAVAIGASCAFLTPIGHQSNTLVMGPGGYQFGDYWRMGLPLELIITVISVPLILIVWPI
mgnify:CR=1 FL=1